MSESEPTYPTEEYIAGRERGRTAGLKRKLKARLIKIAVVTLLGGGYCALTFSSTVVTGYKHGSPRLFVAVLLAFVVLGCITGVWAARSYRQSLSHLREDIVRSVMSPDDAAPQPGRLRKWWIHGVASSAPAWDAPPRYTPWNKSPSDTTDVN